MVNNNAKASTTFNGANGIKNAVSVASTIAFIKANGGLGAVALQLTPNAVAKNGVMFGGGRLHKGLQPNAKTGVYGGRATILWACVNGFANGKLISTVAPTTVPKAVPLVQIQQAHNAFKASVFANANTPVGGNTNQNALVAILNGGFSNACPLYGTAYGKLVLLAS